MGCVTLHSEGEGDVLTGVVEMKKDLSVSSKFMGPLPSGTNTLLIQLKLRVNILIL